MPQESPRIRMATASEPDIVSGIAGCLIRAILDCIMDSDRTSQVDYTNSLPLGRAWFEIVITLAFGVLAQGAAFAVTFFFGMGGHHLPQKLLFPASMLFNTWKAPLAAWPIPLLITVFIVGQFFWYAAIIAVGRRVRRGKFAIAAVVPFHLALVIICLWTPMPGYRD
jgi:hypothetical protein